MLQMNQKLKIDPEVIMTELEEDKEAVLLHMRTKMYYTLNETGCFIWQKVQQGYSIENIIQQILTEYAVTTDKARESVLKHIDELIKEKLLIPANDQS